MKETLTLLPWPRHLNLTAGLFSLPESGTIVLDTADAQSLWFTACLLREALREKAAVDWDIVAGTAGPMDKARVLLSLVPGSVGHGEGYQLTVTSERIHAVAESPAGLFYAVQTLTQILDQVGRELPTLRCRDWPDFPNRGVMLDISRDKVPTMATLFSLIDLLASWKINQFQLYTEHTFAYRNHPIVWADASPMTGEEILVLDAYCRERFVELVPNQNSFGHMRRWLVHEAYNHLAECPSGCETIWGYFAEPFSLYPGDPGSLSLVRDMFDELLPHFSSRQFNVGCDETVDLGRGRSEEVVAERGVGQVYLDFLLQIYREVKARERVMQFWGDIVITHPELVARLPRDVIALEWGYEADHPFDAHGSVYADSGVPFYVCPGTSSWNTVGGRTNNALGNLRNAAENGLKHGAIGYLITDWGDNGHWQPLPVSYLGFGYGAAVAWSLDANKALDVTQAVSRFAFHDPSGLVGRFAYDLGNLYERLPVQAFNATFLFRILQTSPQEIAARGESKEEYRELLVGLEELIPYIEQLSATITGREVPQPEDRLLQQELHWAAGLLSHACRRGIWALSRAQGSEPGDLLEALSAESEMLLDQYEHVWHARNRPGGFKDSLARLQTMRSHYLVG